MDSTPRILFEQIDCRRPQIGMCAGGGQSSITIETTLNQCDTYDVVWLWMMYHRERDDTFIANYKNKLLKLV